MEETTDSDLDAHSLAVDRKRDAWNVKGGMGLCDLHQPNCEALACACEGCVIVLQAPFLCAREFATRMIGSGEEGVIVNISSSARNGDEKLEPSNYSAAKAGLAADTVVWAKELAKYNIRVGAIAPGVVHTQILDSVPKNLLDDLIAKVPLGRLGQEDDVWQGLKFILECNYFTGRVVEIDGGITL
eukprot:768320-Hanusia_phi.AAC.14